MLLFAAPAGAAPTTTVQRTIFDCDGDNLLDLTLRRGAPAFDDAVRARGRASACAREVRRGRGAAPAAERVDRQLPPALGLPDRRRGVARARRVARLDAACPGPPAVLGGLPPAGVADNPDHRGDGAPGAQRPLAGDLPAARPDHPDRRQRRLSAVQRDALVHRHPRRHDRQQRARRSTRTRACRARTRRDDAGPRRPARPRPGRSTTACATAATARSLRTSATTSRTARPASARTATATRRAARTTSRETPGRDVTVRDFPGLFEAANEPFEAVGLGMPWYSRVRQPRRAHPGQQPGGVPRPGRARARSRSPRRPRSTTPRSTGSRPAA